MTTLWRLCCLCQCLEKVGNVGVFAPHCLLAVGEDEGEQLGLTVTQGTHEGVEGQFEWRTNLL